MYFRNYRLSKTWLDQSLKSTISGDPLTVNMLKGPKHLSNLDDSTFIIVFHQLTPLVICEILVVFANTLAANDKYPVRQCDNLWLLIQMQLS